MEKENQEEKIILFDSPEAAQLKTITKWVSSDGRVWPNEDAARYAGCTHNKCECGSIKKRGYIRCDSCSAKRAAVEYEKLKFKEWDGKEPVCLFDGEKYFFDQEDIDIYCEDNDIKPQDLQLVICEPNHFNGIDEDYWADIMPADGDGELPKALQEKLAEFNEFIKTLPPCSYSPSNVRTAYNPVD